MLKNIIIMAAVVALAVVAFIFIPKLQPKTEEIIPQETPDRTDLIISQYTVEETKQVTLEFEGNTLVIFYDEKDEKYKIRDDEEIELNQSEVRNIFYTASYVEAEEIIREDLSDIAQFGLDNPVAKVTAEYSDGKSNTFYFGNTAPGSGTYYMIMEGIDKVLNVWNNYGNNAKTKLNELRLIDIQKYEIEDLEVIRLHKDGKLLLEISNNGKYLLTSMSSWNLTAPYIKGLHSNEESKTFSALIDSVLLLVPKEIISGDASPSEFGLDKPWGVVDMELSDGESVSISFGDTVESTVAMKYSNSDIIYGIYMNKLSFFEYKAIDIIERLLSLVNVKNISKIELSGVAGNNTLEINHNERKDDEGNPKLDGNGEPISDNIYIIDGEELSEDDQEQGTWFYQAILYLEIVREVEENDYTPGQIKGAIRYHYVDNSFIYNIEFYNYDEYFYAVKLQDNEVYLVINKNDVDVLPELFENLRSREMEKP